MEAAPRRRTMTDLLRITPVCDTILKFTSDVEDLKSIRLVCKEWRDISLKKWRCNAMISLIPHRYAVCGTEDDGLGEVISPDLMKMVFRRIGWIYDFDDYLNLHPSSYKTDSYSFTSFNIVCHHFNHLLLDHPFWTEVGSKITHLKLTTFHPEDYGLVPMLNTIFKKCLNLQKVVLQNEFAARDETLQVTRYCHCPVIEDLSKVTHTELEPAPKLTSFVVKELFPTRSFPNLGEEDARKIAKLLLNLKNLELSIKGAGFLPILRHGKGEPVIMLERLKLNCSQQILGPHVAALAEYFTVAKPPLKSLELMTDFVEPHLTIIGCTRLFASCRNTLQHLNLHINPTKSLTDRIFFNYDLPVLKKLYLHGAITITLASLSRMPNLELFHTSSSRTSLETGGNNVVLKNLKYLHLDGQTNSKSIQIFSKCMPNLKVLEIRLEHTMNSSVLLLKDKKGNLIWPALEKLVILPYAGMEYFDSSDDEAFQVY